MSTATDLAALQVKFNTTAAYLQAQITALQQRAARDEAQINDLRAQLAKVKKG